jgi:DNA-binding LacI/PurR family transcriptional regulator
MTPVTKRITLKDVAKEAGVSAMAVSKVLNDKGGISKETTQRILEVVKRLNYRPDNIAKSLRVQETNTIGVVVSDSSHLVFTWVLRGVQDAAAKSGHSVIVVNSDQNVEKEKMAVDVLLSQRIDGLILAAPLRLKQEELEEIKQTGTPTVVLMRSSSDAGIDSVENDNFQGGYDIVNYLLNTGSQVIHFLAMPESSQPSSIRIRGYKQAFADHGLTFDESKLFYCEPFIEAGYAMMQRLIDNGLKKGAVCCGCDMIAIGGISAIRERGLDVPGDIRVTGYDDIDLMDYLAVPLTTIRQPKYEIGFEGVQLLMERIQDPSRVSRHIAMRSELVIRKST